MKNKSSVKLGLTTLTVIIGIALTPIANAKTIATPFSRSRWPHPFHVVGGHTHKSLTSFRPRHTSVTSIKLLFMLGTRPGTSNLFREPLLTIK